MSPTQCSANDKATLDVSAADISNSQVECDESTWGFLFSLNPVFREVQLTYDEYSFGRGDDSTVILEKPERSSQFKYWQTYSRTQFIIKREFKTGIWGAWIEDRSSNGTFLNGKKIGKNCVEPLPHNSEIALSFQHNKAYVYVDLERAEDDKIPSEVKSKYRLCNVLGKGACGEVKLAFDKTKGKPYAIKIVQKSMLSLSKMDSHCAPGQALKEAEILSRLSHPNIIRIGEVFESDKELFLVLEFIAGGELFDKIVNCGKLSEKFSKFIMFQVLSGLEYLHSKSITHRDLKPENLLLSNHDTEEPVLKITDFGLSKVIDQATQMKTFCGTPTYLAPEILQNRGLGTYTEKVDCWSIGVILYCCLAGSPPFSDQRKDLQLYDQILQGAYTFPSEQWADVSADAKEVVSKLMCLDVQTRVSITEALALPWFTGDNETVERAKVIMLEEEQRLKNLMAGDSHEMVTFGKLANSTSMDCSRSITPSTTNDNLSKEMEISQAKSSSQDSMPEVVKDVVAKVVRSGKRASAGVSSPTRTSKRLKKG